MALPEALEATLQVAAVLEGLGIPYLVGGSLASSLHGIPRATADADLLACLTPEQASTVASGLEAASTSTRQ